MRIWLLITAFALAAVACGQQGPLYLPDAPPPPPLEEADAGGER